MSGPFKLKGWSPFTQKEEKKNILGTIHEKLQKIKDPLQKYKSERKMRKAKEASDAGKSYVHKYYKKGTTEDWPGHGPGRGKLKPGYPKWVD